MTSHDNELASSQPDLARQEERPHGLAPEIEEAPPALGPTQSGWTILLNWCLMFAGLGLIAFFVWLFG